jgi:leucyl/phenylalanyl-tRNA--protein transferase
MSGSPPGLAPRLVPYEAIRPVVEALPFPDPSEARMSGLLAVGGDLSPERLIAAYAQGVFPWYDDPPIRWYSTDPRMLLWPDELHVSRSLARTIRRGRFEVRYDTAFEAVMRACRDTPRPDQDGTWINDDMLRGYTALHDLGFAHSIESWEGGELVGGVYGVSIGAAFFGESMFAHRSDASKVAFVHAVRRMRDWGFDFIDCQVYTEHTARFGAREVPRGLFLDALTTALESPSRCGRWSD